MLASKFALQRIVDLFFHSIHQYLLGTYKRGGPNWDAKDSSVTMTLSVPSLAYILVSDTENQQIGKQIYAQTYILILVSDKCSGGNIAR